MAHYDHTIEAAAKLKAKAARYRNLVDGTFDPSLVAEVTALARELESEATSLERWRDRSAG